jgi:hypothetical protein
MKTKNPFPSERVVTETDFNTNNGWGFGGGIGTEFVYASGAKVRKGCAYYRHTGTSPFFVVYDNSGKVIYDHQSMPKVGTTAYGKILQIIRGK